MATVSAGQGGPNQHSRQGGELLVSEPSPRCQDDGVRPQSFRRPVARLKGGCHEVHSMSQLSRRRYSKKQRGELVLFFDEAGLMSARLKLAYLGHPDRLDTILLWQASDMGSPCLFLHRCGPESFDTAA